jgi:hypothetical protein
LGSFGGEACTVGKQETNVDAGIKVSDSHGRVALGLVSNMLGLLMAPGDVLITTEAGARERGFAFPGFGAAGGIMGHALLVVSQPRSFEPDPWQKWMLQEACPAARIGPGEIWRIRTVESTRSAPGLHTVDTLFCVEHGSGQLVIIAEIDEEGTFYPSEATPVQLWQSPSELRACLSMELFEEVLADMKARETDWSYITAARAVLTSAATTLSGRYNACSLADIQASWQHDPICTSVVIAFWQRYLCKLAEASAEINALELIQRWMPLQCDRALPGDLVSSLLSCGWILVSHIPRIFWPIYMSHAASESPAAEWIMSSVPSTPRLRSHQSEAEDPTTSSIEVSYATFNDGLSTPPRKEHSGLTPPMPAAQHWESMQTTKTVRANVDSSQISTEPSTPKSNPESSGSSSSAHAYARQDRISRVVSL